MTNRLLWYIIFVFGVLDTVFVIMWLWDRFKMWINKLVKEELDKKFKENMK